MAKDKQEARRNAATLLRAISLGHVTLVIVPFAHPAPVPDAGDILATDFSEVITELEEDKQ